MQTIILSILLIILLAFAIVLFRTCYRILDNAVTSALQLLQPKPTSSPETSVCSAVTCSFSQKSTPAENFPNTQQACE